MIPAKSETTVESTVKGTAVAMGLAADALPHVISILTNMYANPREAVIREYSTNALDSHVQAGQTKPIEVSTPTDLRPLFTVRDYGIGLDSDDISNVLSLYGASTKRDSNEAVGMLGIGCKSALAYADQFTITGWKDGMRTMVSVARDESGAGTMTVLDSAPSDEPTGAEIAVPCREAGEISSEAARFFAHWEPGTVLVDGEAPAPVQGLEMGDFTVELGDTLPTWQRREARGGKLRVVMGNVPYPAPSDFEHPALANLPYNSKLVARVPIGTLQFAPSREALMASERTTEALDEIMDAFIESLNEYAAAHVEGAETAADAVRGVIELHNSVGAKNLPQVSWNDQEVPTHVAAADGYALYKTGTGSKGGGWYQTSTIEMLDAQKYVWITDFTNKAWGAPMRSKLERYMEATELSEDPAHEIVIVTTGDAVPGGEWMEGVRQIDWATVRAWKDPDKPAAVRGPARKYAGTYSTFRNGVWRESVSAESLAESDDAVYYFIGVKHAMIAYNASMVLKDSHVVVMPSSRADKFKRLFPNAKSQYEPAKAAALKWCAALDDSEQRFLAIQDSYDGRSVAGLLAALYAGGEIADAELADWAEAAASDPAIKATYAVCQQILGEYDTKVPEFPACILERYPLLSHVPHYEVESLAADLRHYVNAAYAARN